VGRAVGQTPSALAPPRLSALTVSHADALTWFEARRPNYERLARAVAPYVERGGVILDVGANIGYFTKVLDEVIEFRGTVHLFEPIPNLAGLCRSTLRDAGFAARVHAFGLSDEDATLTIYVASSGNLGWNTIVAERAVAGMDPVTIEVRAFDGLGLNDRPSMIKIDVEGAEFRVLRGMASSLKGWTPKPTILCEVGWGRAHPNWNDELDEFGQLERMGYRTVDTTGGQVTVADLDRTTDIIFLPPDST
jgi:FkbM family methyltransferase